MGPLQPLCTTGRGAHDVCFAMVYDRVHLQFPVLNGSTGMGHLIGRGCEDHLPNRTGLVEIESGGVVRRVFRADPADPQAGAQSRRVRSPCAGSFGYQAQKSDLEGSHCVGPSISATFLNRHNAWSSLEGHFVQLFGACSDVAFSLPVLYHVIRIM